MGLPPMLMQALFIYNLLKMSVPFTRHRYWLYPFVFFLLAIPALFLILLGAFSAADAEARLVVQRADRRHLSPEVGNADPDGHHGATFVHVPKSFEVLCMANVTMASLTMMAVFCMLAWILYQAERGWAVYVQQILLDVMVFEKTIWKEATDLRGVVPPEVLPS